MGDLFRFFFFDLDFDLLRDLSLDLDLSFESDLLLSLCLRFDLDLGRLEELLSDNAGVFPRLDVCDDNLSDNGPAG